MATVDSPPSSYLFSSYPPTDPFVQWMNERQERGCLLFHFHHRITNAQLIVTPRLYIRTDPALLRNFSWQIITIRPGGLHC